MMTNTEFILKIITTSFYFRQVASSGQDKPEVVSVLMKHYAM
jgi:hypothetical protein